MSSQIKKACVYKLVCKNPEIKDMYIGSTKNIHQRAYNHYLTSNNPTSKEYNKKSNVYIRENGGWDNFELIKLCDVEYTEIKELRKKEQEYIDTLKPTLNKSRAYNYDGYAQIYRDSRKEQKSESNRKYYLKNKQRLQDYKKIYRAKKKEELKKLKEIEKIKQEEHTLQLQLTQLNKTLEIFKKLKEENTILKQKLEEQKEIDPLMLEL